MVERVKELRGELHVYAFCDVVALRDREIPVVHVIHADTVNISRFVPESHYVGGIYRREARRVEPTSRSSVLTRARCLQIA